MNVLLDVMAGWPSWLALLHTDILRLGRNMW